MPSSGLMQDLLQALVPSVDSDSVEDEGCSMSLSSSDQVSAAAADLDAKEAHLFSISLEQKRRCNWGCWLQSCSYVDCENK